MAPVIEFEMITDMAETVELLDRSFPNGFRHDARYLDWLYRDSGPAAAKVVAVMRAGRKIGQMVFLPRDMEIAGETRRYGLVVDFFILPEHRSGPLTIRLCRQAVEMVAAAGLDGIFGVPNAVSMGITPRLLKPKITRKLEVRAGLAVPRRDRVMSRRVSDLSDAALEDLVRPFVAWPRGGQVWSALLLRRRLKSPSTDFSVHVCDDVLAVSCRVAIRGFMFTMLSGFLSPSKAAIPRSVLRRLIGAACAAQRRPQFCYIGYNAALAELPGFAVPPRFHPSPMTITSRPLARPDEECLPDRFELIDFDLV